MEFLPEQILKCKRIGLGGLGGGADIINSTVLYPYLLSKEIDVTLISCHGRPMNFLEGGTKITAFSKWVDETCTRGTGDRVFEHNLCKAIMNVIEPLGLKTYKKPRVAFITRHGEVEGVAHALDVIAYQENLDAILLIDGGGDALECNSHFTTGTSHKGDSLVIQALTRVVKVPTYVGIVACGIDTPDNWRDVVKEIKNKKGHLGVYDIKDLDKTLLQPAMEVMRKSVKMTDNDGDHLCPSLTCTTFWCSLAKFYKSIATQASWKPKIEVVPEFSKLRVFKAKVLHLVKENFNKPKPSQENYRYKNNLSSATEAINVCKDIIEPRKNELHYRFGFWVWARKYLKF